MNIRALDTCELFYNYEKPSENYFNDTIDETPINIGFVMNQIEDNICKIWNYGFMYSLRHSVFCNLF